MSLVGSLRGVQANPEPCNSNSNSKMRLQVAGRRGQGVLALFHRGVLHHNGQCKDQYSTVSVAAAAVHAGYCCSSF
jgi:hypothetical protein